MLALTSWFTYAYACMQLHKPISFPLKIIDYITHLFEILIVLDCLGTFAIIFSHVVATDYYIRLSDTFVLRAVKASKLLPPMPINIIRSII
jgi:hypothetical protein